jgi:hypothetical protein
MARFHVVALLAIGAIAVPAQAQPPAPIQPSPDSAQQRKDLRTLASCLARARPGWARQTLSQPYLSDAQAYAASQALSGNDNCIRGFDVEVTFRTSGLVGSLAEHFVQAEIGRADSTRLARTLAALPPLNVSEDFALCVAARHPAAARALALSEPGSDAEMEAVGRIASAVEPCTNQGERLTVDLQSLRALTSVALYRGISTVTASR